MAELPAAMSAEAKQTMGPVNPRLEPLTLVLGVEVGGQTKAFPIDQTKERACYTDSVGGESVAVFWYQPTRSAIAWNARLDDRTLHFYADTISPETAPFKDKETGTRWTLAGRGIDGPLKGKELTWVAGVQCRWYAWSAEYPDTGIFAAAK
jgi:hypothetical protein